MKRGDTVEDFGQLRDGDIVRWRYKPAELERRGREPYWCKSQLGIVRESPRWGRRLCDLYWSMRSKLDMENDFFSSDDYNNSWSFDEAAGLLDLTYLAQIRSLRRAGPRELVLRSFKYEDIVDLTHPNSHDQCFVYNEAKPCLLTEREHILEDVRKAEVVLACHKRALELIDERIAKEAV